MSNEVIGTFIQDDEIIIVKEHSIVVMRGGDKVIEIPNIADQLRGDDHE